MSCYNTVNRHERKRGRALQVLRLRRSVEAGQGDPGHLLAERREPGGLGQSPYPDVIAADLQAALDPVHADRGPTGGSE